MIFMIETPVHILYTVNGFRARNAAHLPSVGSNILASMELESAQRVALVVAKTLPPTFSLTQSLRGVPSEDGADTVLRNMKSGTSVEGVRETAL